MGGGGGGGGGGYQEVNLRSISRRLSKLTPCQQNGRFLPEVREQSRSKAVKYFQFSREPCKFNMLTDFSAILGQ